jgi:hypothetical protein
MGLIQKAFGDIITFSRSSNATRIGPNGLVQYAPHNLALQSQTFDNASWNTGNGSVTANSIAAPDGSVTADKFSEDSATGEHFIYQAASFTVGNVNTFSIYIKAAERSVVRLSAGSTARWDARAFFDVLSGTVTSVVNGSASIQSVGNGWYRCVLTGSVLTTGSTNVEINLGSSGTTIVYAGTTGSGIYLWGAQLSVGSVPGDYTPTTSAAVYGPRFDFDPVTLAARGLLIEEQRTNLLQRSEEFDNGSWTKTGGSVTPNSITAPDGSVTADLFVENSSLTSHRVSQNASITSGIAYTLSVFAKAGSRTFLQLFFSSTEFGAQAFANFDLSTGVAGTIGSSTVATITSAGGGWYRCSISATATATGASSASLIQLITSSTAARNENYTGDGTSGLYLWGAQLEAGSFATSYIPTLASAVTRSADVATINTLSPFFNATEGTMFAQFDSAASGTNTIAAFDDNTANENYRLRNVGTDPKFTVTDGGVDQCDINGGTIAANTVYNFAAAYKANDFAVCIAGGTVQTDTSGTLPTVDRLRIGTSQAGNYLNGHVRRFAYYPRRLANAELQALTA